MRRGPSKALLLAMALASENLVFGSAAPTAIRRVWCDSTTEARRYWLRKAKRVLARLHALDLGAGHG